MVIGVTDNMGSEHKWQMYIDWLLRGGKSIRYIKLSYPLKNAEEVHRCDGLVMTGGSDIDSKLYNGSSNQPKLGNVDRRRDDFELKILDVALNRRIPILGICRGMQITNVLFGGTLIPDVEEAGFTSHQSRSDNECRHRINILEPSSLFKMVGATDGSANSSHHQAVLKLGNGLKTVAQSEDGVTEALEYESMEGKPFFLHIQWHPERMNDFDNPLSRNILNHFLTSITIQ